MRPLPIGAAIRAAREAAGLSRREVARRMGCDESQLRAVEAGRHGVTVGSPGGGTLERVVDALRTTTEDEIICAAVRLRRTSKPAQL